MKVNYALNHHWYETRLLPQTVSNYAMSRDFIVKKSEDQSCILTRMKKSVWHCFISEFFLYFHYTLHHCSMWVTSVLVICMSQWHLDWSVGQQVAMTQFQLWIWYSFWHENLCGYHDNFIYKIACCYSKNRQNWEVFWIIMVHYRLYTLYY